MATAASRRPKWRHHPPPPPTPRILHFPRRRPSSQRDLKGNTNRLGTLIDRERRARVPIVVLDNSGDGERRRERVENNSESPHGWALEEEKWKFQAEMLRAECNLLRMEKEIAVKKLERTRVKMETTLRSALHTLVSGRIKICEGKKVDMVLDEEIHDLTKKLQRLHRRSKVKDLGARNNRNFDKQVSVLRRRLEKFGGSSDEIYLREFQEMENISLSIKRSSRIDDSIVASGKLNVDILRRKMEGLSKGILLQRMEEEYNSLLSTASSSLASSGSTSKRVEFQDSSSIRVPHQEKLSCEGNPCSGHCKTIVRRIVEQVRVETEQWSQMQEMLGQVREEMEELQASRDFWEDQARHSDFQIQSLHNAVQEWKQKALSSESKTNELEAELSTLRGDLERLRKEQNAVKGTKCSPIPVDTQNELEKRIVVCCSKENNNVTENSKHNDILRNAERKAHAARGGFLAPKRSPLRDIGNSSLLMRQNGKAVFPLRCHLSSDVEKIY
ncbi:Myosin-related isoform 1 [Spatholobus suberectus]|nr:Myosin-related isoform 1 [Spatholobus suberectus]